MIEKFCAWYLRWRARKRLGLQEKKLSWDEIAAGCNLDGRFYRFDKDVIGTEKMREDFAREAGVRDRIRWDMLNKVEPQRIVSDDEMRAAQRKWQEECDQFIKDFEPKQRTSAASPTSPSKLD